MALFSRVQEPAVPVPLWARRTRHEHVLAAFRLPEGGFRRGLPSLASRRDLAISRGTRARYGRVPSINLAPCKVQKEPTTASAFRKSRPLPRLTALLRAGITRSPTP